MGKKNKAPAQKIETKINCESCQFNVGMDDEKMRCEFMKMLGKNDPACEKYEPKR